jgi:hypothetical protein
VLPSFDLHATSWHWQEKAQKNSCLATIAVKSSEKGALFMKTRYFALIVGIVFVSIGLLGFIPNLISLPVGMPAFAIKGGYAYLFGLFPLNLWHNIIHLIVGTLGIIAYRRLEDARLFAQGLTIFYALLAVFGLIPYTQTMFGYIPIFGHNVWLHGFTALIAAYFGYIAPETTLVGKRTL